MSRSPFTTPLELEEALRSYMGGWPEGALTAALLDYRDMMQPVLVELAARRTLDESLTRDNLDAQLIAVGLSPGLWQRSGIEALVTIVGRAAAKVKRGKFWANVDNMGSPYAVGPFKTKDDADLFRLMMFSSDIGFTGTQPAPATARTTVAGFQTDCRADFGTRPPHHWGARY